MPDKNTRRRGSGGETATISWKEQFFKIREIGPEPELSTKPPWEKPKHAHVKKNDAE